MRRGQAFEDWFKAQEPLLHGRIAGSLIDGWHRPYGKRSQQIDVVLYDPRFPIMEFDKGIGLYPIEGVICTIEVKSILEGDKFIAALENCHSVHELGIAVPLQSSLRKRAEAFSKEFPDMPMREALIKAGCEFYPATYIVAFQGVQAETICNTVEEWFNSREHRVREIRQTDKPLGGVVPALPRVIMSGKNIGAAHDGWFRYVLHDEQAQQRLDDKYGPVGRVMMFTLATQSPLWWLASHILHTTSNRLRMVHGTMAVRYRVDHYIEPPGNLGVGSLYEVGSSIQDFS
jgi:hypothetical protein